MGVCRPYAGVADILAVSLGAEILKIVPGRVCCPTVPQARPLLTVWVGDFLQSSEILRLS